MSEYDKTRFYWLQLKEDFFEDDSIMWLEDQGPKGKEYAYFYLKLCIKSLKTDGILIRRVGELLIPYDCEKLAEMTRTDFDTVKTSIELLSKIGLVKILDNGEIYLPQVENMVGSQSKGAFKKQQQRRVLSGGQLSTHLSSTCPTESESESKLKQHLNLNDRLINKACENLENEKTMKDFLLSSYEFTYNDVEDMNLKALFITKKCYFSKETFSILDKLQQIKVVLMQEALQYFKDKNEAYVIDEFTEALADKVLGRLFNQPADSIKNVIMYFITSIENEIINNHYKEKVNG